MNFEELETEGPKKGWDDLSLDDINGLPETEQERLIAIKFKSQLDMARTQNLKSLSETINELQQREGNLIEELGIFSGESGVNKADLNPEKWKELTETTLLSVLLTRIMQEKLSQSRIDYSDDKAA